MRSRILTNHDGERGSTSAYVVWGQNHLLLRRQFAWDGRVWYYQPDSRSAFQPVSENGIPDNVKRAMAFIVPVSVRHLVDDSCPVCDSMGAIVGVEHTRRGDCMVR